LATVLVGESRRENQRAEIKGAPYGIVSQGLFGQEAVACGAASSTPQYT
jgi:hypothetical protein